MANNVVESPLTVDAGGGVSYSKPAKAHDACDEQSDVNVLIFHRLNELNSGQHKIQDSQKAVKDSLDKITERVTTLEVSEKYTRWAIGGICLVGGMLLREILPLIVKFIGG